MRAFKVILFTVLVSTFVAAGLLLNYGSEDSMKAQLNFQGEFPEKHTCDGRDVSPPINVSKLPENTETLVVVIDDPDASGQTFDHWMIWNLPPNRTIPENIPKERNLETGAAQGKNDFGEIGYNGPCPPRQTHTYRIKIYALDTALELASGSSKEKLENLMNGHVIDQTTIRREYSR